MGNRVGTTDHQCPQDDDGCKTAVRFLDRFGQPDGLAAFSSGRETHPLNRKNIAEVDTECGRRRGQDQQLEVAMHQIVEPLTLDPARPLRVSRRALLEGSVSSALGAAALGGSSAVIGLRTASAADSAAGGGSRQMATFRIRQAAAQAYLDEQVPPHRSNGDETRYPDKRASFAKTLPHNEAGEVDAEAFATFVSVLSSGDPDGFERDPTRPRC
jgi:hypothetical protein